MNTDINVGRVHAGETDVIAHRRLWRFDNSKPAVLFSHGAGGTAVTSFLAVATGQLPLMRALAAQYPLLSGDWGGAQTWGNTTAQSRMAEGKTAAQGSLLGAKSGKVVLVGASMGGLNCLNYARANPTTVSCIVIIIPVVDLDDVRNNDRGSQGFRSAIDAAWGVTYPAALPGGANPSTNTGGYSGIPIQIWYASDDPLIIPSTVTTFGAAVGAEMHNVGALGHTEAAIAAVDTATVLSFIATYA